MRFYDRDNEIAVLKEIEQQSRKSATFTVLMGRRRVGKTSLILRSLQEADHVYLFVSKDSEAMLCEKFQRAIESELNIKVYGALTHFRDVFEVLMRESVNRPFTVILDEFQNLAKVNPAIFDEEQEKLLKYLKKQHVQYK